MQSDAKKRVKGIAKLKVDRREFDEQARRLQEWNVVYGNTEYQEQLVAQWCPDPNIPEVPQIIVDSVVAVPVEEDPGKVVASGPADATESGEMDKADADVQAAKQARYISAFDPESLPGAGESAACLELASLQQQLEDLEATAQRSVAAEVESALESGACLVDDAGRERILDLCKKIRENKEIMPR